MQTGIGKNSTRGNLRIVGEMCRTGGSWWTVVKTQGLVGGVGLVPPAALETVWASSAR